MDELIQYFTVSFDSKLLLGLRWNKLWNGDEIHF